MTIYLAVIGLVITGVAWLLLPDPDTSTTARWMLRMHGVVAYVFLLGVGTVLPLHVRLAWIRRRNRASGVVLALLVIALAASGLWLYYGTLAGRSAVSLEHWIVGLVLPVWVVLHRAFGRGSRP